MLIYNILSSNDNTIVSRLARDPFHLPINHKYQILGYFFFPFVCKIVLVTYNEWLLVIK